MHDAARGRIERIATMQRAAVVPEDKVVALPHLAEGELGFRRMRPQPVEQRLARGEVEADDVAIAPAAEVERGAMGFRMHDDERMARATRLSRIGDRLHSLAHAA